MIILAAAGCLLLLASFSFNTAQFELASNDYTDKSTFTDRLPDNFSRIGLQLVYSLADEKEDAAFLEDLAVELEEAGMGSAVILPALINLDESGVNLEGVLLLTVNAEVSGWQLKRQGSATATARFIPLMEAAVTSMRSNIASTATASGWLSRSYFTDRLLGYTVAQMAQAVSDGLELNSGGMPVEGSRPFVLEPNLDELPSNLSFLLPEGSSLLACAVQGESFMLTFETEDSNIEAFLSESIIDNFDVEKSMDWVNTAGPRRMANFSAGEEYNKIEVYYSYTEDIGENGQYIRPGSPELDAPKVVTIIKHR